MTLQIEMHLREMGILPANIFDEMEQPFLKALAEIFDTTVCYTQGFFAIVFNVGMLLLSKSDLTTVSLFLGVTIGLDLLAVACMSISLIRRRGDV